MSKIADLNFKTTYKPLVSICVLTYNHQDYIKQCIESFLNQEVNFEVEILIHDDASTDDTQIILSEYDKKHPGLFKLLLQTENQRSKFGGGMNPRFNYPRSNGKYIALCEGDDYWTDPLKLQKQVDFLEDNIEFSLCGTLAQRIYDNDAIPPDIEGEAGVFQQQDIADRNFIPTASVLFQRSHINNFPDWVLECPVGDWPLFLICATYGKIKVFKDQMVVRRIHQGGVWGANLNSNNSIKNVTRLYDMFYILKDKFSDDVNCVLNKNYLRQLIKIVELNLKKEDFDKVDQYLHLLLQQGTDLTEETRQLTVTISNKLTNQEEEINQLKTLNTQLTNSTSYKFGRQITGIFKFLKT